jgi:hypothetical protein
MVTVNNFFEFFYICNISSHKKFSHSLKSIEYIEITSAYHFEQALSKKIALIDKFFMASDFWPSINNLINFFADCLNHLHDMIGLFSFEI